MLKKRAKNFFILIAFFMIGFLSNNQVYADEYHKEQAIDKAYEYWNKEGLNYSRNNVYSYWTGKTYAVRHRFDYVKNSTPITYNVAYCYEEAYKMLDLVNAERRKNGVHELIGKDEIMKVAMQRAAESAIYWEHTRPDGSCSSSVSLYDDNENICANADDAQDANKNLVESKGHYETMLDPDYYYAGFGCVIVDGTPYWTQVFSIKDKYYEDGYDKEYHYQHDMENLRIHGKYLPSPNDRPIIWEKLDYGKLKDCMKPFTAKVNPKLLCLTSKPITNLKIGEERESQLFTHYQNSLWTCNIALNEDQYDVKVLTPDIIAYHNQKVRGLKEGTGKLLFTLKANPNMSITIEVEVTKNLYIKKGSQVAVDGNIYKVIGYNRYNKKYNQVSFYKAKKNIKTISIPNIIKINGKEFKVSIIEKNAFLNQKKLIKVSIGTNIKEIKEKGFYGCKKLKKIYVKSTKITKVGKNAFKGIHKKATIKVPKKKYKKYKKIFAKRGQSSFSKIKK